MKQLRLCIYQADQIMEINITGFRSPMMLDHRNRGACAYARLMLNRIRFMYIVDKEAHAKEWSDAKSGIRTWERLVLQPQL